MEENKAAAPQLMTQKSKFMTFIERPDLNVVELYVRGEFPAPDEVTDELIDLAKYSEVFPEIHVYINSLGGLVDTCCEMVGLLSDYKFSVTIANGACQSAGLVLWAAGNLRVAREFASIMTHRETYGMIGKTTEQIEYAMHLEKIDQGFVSKILKTVFTVEELEKAKYTQVYLTGAELAERGVAYTWDEFNALRSNISVESSNVLTVHGVRYLMDGVDAYEIVDMTIDNEPQNIYTIIYAEQENPIEIEINPQEGETNV